MLVGGVGVARGAARSERWLVAGQSRPCATAVAASRPLSGRRRGKTALAQSAAEGSGGWGGGGGEWSAGEAGGVAQGGADEATPASAVSAPSTDNATAAMAAAAAAASSSSCDGNGDATGSAAPPPSPSPLLGPALLRRVSAAADANDALDILAEGLGGLTSIGSGVPGGIVNGGSSSSPLLTEEACREVLAACLERDNAALALSIFTAMTVAAAHGGATGSGSSLMSSFDEVPAGASRAAVRWPAASVQTAAALVVGLCQALRTREATQIISSIRGRWVWGTWRAAVHGMAGATALCTERRGRRSGALTGPAPASMGAQRAEAPTHPRNITPLQGTSHQRGRGLWLCGGLPAAPPATAALAAGAVAGAAAAGPLGGGSGRGAAAAPGSGAAAGGVQGCGRQLQQVWIDGPQGRGGVCPGHVLGTLCHAPRWECCALHKACPGCQGLWGLVRDPRHTLCCWCCRYEYELFSGRVTSATSGTGCHTA